MEGKGGEGNGGEGKGRAGGREGKGRRNMLQGVRGIDAPAEVVCTVCLNSIFHRPLRGSCCM